MLIIRRACSSKIIQDSEPNLISLLLQLLRQSNYLRRVCSHPRLERSLVHYALLHRCLGVMHMLTLIQNPKLLQIHLELSQRGLSECSNPPKQSIACQSTTPIKDKSLRYHTSSVNFAKPARITGSGFKQVTW